MGSPYLNSSEFDMEFDLLSSHGTLGFYNAVEVYTVFYNSKNATSPPNNFYTLVYFVEIANPILKGKESLFLTKKLFSHKVHHNEYSFGILKTTANLSAFSHWYKQYLVTRLWNFTGKLLNLGVMKFTPKFFVPPNGTYDSALNNILKNNFFNGSYILEEFDEEKSHLSVFLDNPDKLLQISQDIQGFLPIKIGAISERLGNILLQFPIRSLRSDFINRLNDRDFTLEYSWDRRLTIPDCNVITINEDIKDNLIKSNLCNKMVKLPHSGKVDSLNGRSLHVIYNTQSNLILGSSNDTILETIGIDLKMQLPEQRTFVIKGQSQGIPVHEKSPIIVGFHPNLSSYTAWTKSRIFEKETRDLEKALKFKQYGIKIGSTTAKERRDKGLADIKFLLNKYADEAVYLWDPYLDADDLKNTLFFIQDSGVTCLAIGSYASAKQRIKMFDPEKDLSKISFKEWLGASIDILKARFGLKKETLSVESAFDDWKTKVSNDLDPVPNIANNYMLKLSFKSQFGKHGFPFHDRFIVFPSVTEQTRAWSLGTSINSFGKEHHILHEVSNAKQIELAFLELWNQLPDDPCLVWSSL